MLARLRSRLFEPLLLALVMTGCASFDGRGLQPGVATQAEVEALMGAPDAVYEEAEGRVLQYPRGPGGQATFMAHLDRQGVLTRIEQVLDPQFFGRVQRGVHTREDILRLFGRPYLETWFPRLKELAWDYRYRENQQDMLFIVQFDESGKVSRTLRLVERYIPDFPDAGTQH